MLTRTARVALNTLTNYFRFGISLVVFFILTPFIIRKIGESDFGLWSLTWAVLLCFTLLDLGFGTGVVKFVAECKGSGDAERRNRLLSGIAGAYVVIALISLLAVYGMSLFYNHLFDIPCEQASKALALLWILGVRLVILALPLGLFRGVLLGEQRIVLINLVQTGYILLYGLGAWGVLAWGFGVVALAWVNLAAMLLEHLAYMSLAFVCIKDLRISLRHMELRLLKEAASFSVFAFVSSIATLVLLRTDPIIVKFFLPLSAVAVYAVGLRIAEQAYLLMKQFTYVLGPFIAELKGTGEEEKIRFVLVNCAKFALAPGVVLCVMTYVFAREALIFWVGPSFAGAAPVLAILMSAMALSIPSVVACEVFTMTGNPRITARLALVSIVLNVSSSVALARPLGVVGVALGSLITTVVVDVAVIVIGCRRHSVPYGVYLRRVFISTMVPGVFQWLMSWTIKYFVPPTGLGAIAWEAIPGLLLYALVFWFFGIEPSEKRLFYEKLFRWRQAAT